MNDIPHQLRCISNDVSRFVADSKSQLNFSAKKNDDMETQQHGKQKTVTLTREGRLQELASAKEALKNTSKTSSSEVVKLRHLYDDLRSSLDELRTQETDYNSQYSSQLHVQQITEEEAQNLRQSMQIYFFLNFSVG